MTLWFSRGSADLPLIQHKKIIVEYFKGEKTPKHFIVNIGDRCFRFITPILICVTTSYMDSVVLDFLGDEAKESDDTAHGKDEYVE